MRVGPTEREDGKAPEECVCVCARVERGEGRGERRWSVCSFFDLLLLIVMWVFSRSFSLLLLLSFKFNYSPFSFSFSFSFSFFFNNVVYYF